MRGSRQHVVIVRRGFGGLSAAKALGRAAVDVTVIDRTNHHLVQPLLHEVATRISEGIALPIRDVLRRQRTTRVVLGAVVDIDLDARRVGVDTSGLRKEIREDTPPCRSPVVELRVCTSQRRGARLQELLSRRSGDNMRQAGARLSDRAPRRGCATSQTTLKRRRSDPASRTAFGGIGRPCR